MSESGSSGSSRQQKQIPVPPLVKCPRCGGQALHFVSRRRNSRGRRFYKCEHQSIRLLNEAGGCSFWKWEEEYYRFLEQLGSRAPAAIPHKLAEIEASVKFMTMMCFVVLGACVVFFSSKK